MQVNKSNFGGTLTDGHGITFKVDGNRVKSDWKYNVHVGMAILRNAYVTSRFFAPHDVVRATYAIYNAPGHWQEYTFQHGTVHDHVQQFMKSYNSLAPW
jgi:hypothetical protein